MTDQRRVFDVAHALAVVVDDSHLTAFFQNVLAFHKTHLICIHHDAQGALGDDGQGVLGVDEVILLPRLAQCIDQAGSQCSVPPDGDDRRHIADLTNAQHALGCADGIQIAHAVTTWSASLINLTSWSATRRLRTLLRFSTPWLTPP